MSGGTSAAAVAGSLGAAAASSAAAAATASAFTLADLGLAATLVSSVVGGVGAIASGNASKAAADYNASIASTNATIAKQNASFAGAAGEAQVEQQSQKTRAAVGGIKAAQAANGLDVNSGSTVDVRSSASELGELSALNIRSNATRTAYGYQNQAVSDQSQAQIDKFQGEQEQLAGEVGGATSLLGGAGNATLNFNKYLGSSSVSGGF